MFMCTEQWLQWKDKIKFKWVLPLIHTNLLKYLVEIGQKDRQNFWNFWHVFTESVDITNLMHFKNYKGQLHMRRSCQLLLKEIQMHNYDISGLFHHFSTMCANVS